MDIAIWISLGLYFVLTLAIAFYAWRGADSTSEHYVLGGRGLSPGVAALSAGASDMSGWLLLGLPGALYVSGLVEAWIGIGLFIGALANWIIVAPRLREQTERYDNALTVPAFMANRFPSRARALRVVSAAIIVVFFAIYTASGLVAGGRLFETVFAELINIPGVSDYAVGIWLTLGVVLIYTVVGGFMAVSFTDVLQGGIMMIALILIPIVVFFNPVVGGVSGVSETIAAIDPNFLSFTSGISLVGFVSAVAWGLGYFGQPHIIVRFMAMRSAKDAPKAATIGLSWMALSLIGAIGVGIMGRIYAERAGLSVSDPETIFIILSNILFHPLITGFLLAALLAAIMSTVSSQLIVASSSLTEDFYHLFLRREAPDKELILIGRVAVVLVAVVAAIIASDPQSQVLGLVANAWAGFGAAFGPLILLALTWPRMTGSGAIAGLVTGAVVVMGWIALGWNASFLGGDGVYEIIPGFFASMAAIILVSLATKDAGEFRKIS
jgi:SSS family solute:Na+ symporter